MRSVFRFFRVLQQMNVADCCKCCGICCRKSNPQPYKYMNALNFYSCLAILFSPLKQSVFCLIGNKVNLIDRLRSKLQIQPLTEAQCSSFNYNDAFFVTLSCLFDSYYFRLICSRRQMKTNEKDYLKASAFDNLLSSDKWFCNDDCYKLLKFCTLSVHATQLNVHKISNAYIQIKYSNIIQCVCVCMGYIQNFYPIKRISQYTGSDVVEPG